MGPGDIAVKVCSKTGRDRYRGDRRWPAAWVEAFVDQELLDVIRADEMLSVRAVDPAEALDRRVSALEEELKATEKEAERLIGLSESLRKKLDVLHAEQKKHPKRAPKPQEDSEYQKILRAASPGPRPAA